MILQPVPEKEVSTRAGRISEDFAALKYWAFIVAALTGAVLASVSHAVLPAKFFLDESIILRFVSGELVSEGLSSYGTTGWLYRVSGLGAIPEFFPVLSYLVFVGTVVTAVTWRGIGRMGLWASLLTCGSLLLGAAYLSQYSKEFFVLPLVFFLLKAHRSVGREVGWMALALLYAWAVRPYWALVVALYVAFRIVIPRIRSARLLIVAIGVGFVALIVAFQVVLGEPLTFFRTDINNALDIDRSTQIDDFILGTGMPIQWLNAVIVMVSLMLPFPLLLSGAGLQTLAGAFMAACWIYLWTQVPDVLRRRGSSMLPVAFLLAFVMVQTAFEPDYGSYIRHIVPLLPLFLAVIVRTSHPERHQEPT